MFNPVATYRIQFHNHFTLRDFDSIIPYLKKLGVSTIYASPIFSAVPGSRHGYDGINPHQINPEIGTEKELLTISQKLKKEGIGWLQDIVPNHVAFHSHNPWLLDVLEKGQQSFYSNFFDITGMGQLHDERLTVPFLGASLEEVIKNKELKVGYEGQRLVLKYYEACYPLSPRSYATILKLNETKWNNDIRAVAERIVEIQQVEEPKAYMERWDELLLRFAFLLHHKTSGIYIESCLQQCNNEPERLQQIAGEQAYRLCPWQETDYAINYRRFFTINGLICLNMQNEDVFHHYHQYIKSLLDKGVFDGLRIDHIDGLHHPYLYLKKLRRLAGDETYIVVEKILGTKEALPEHWPIQGTTGYDFLSIVNNVFAQINAETLFTGFYQNLTKDRTPIHQQIRDKKAYILYRHMGGELENLCRFFVELNLIDEEELDLIHPVDLKGVIGEFLIQCPVYRYYGTSFPLYGEESAAVQEIINRIKGQGEVPGYSVQILERTLLQQPKGGDEDYNNRAAQFYQRCMQFTGPLMAKGVEDTLLYTYHRFIAHNEVGNSPEAFGCSIEAFHKKMQQRLQTWPLSLNTTSTHDTKRGEDVRARLNVLTDLPDEWLQAVEEWRLLQAGLKQNGAPDVADEYFMYQSLAGAYPMTEEGENDFGTRFTEYVQKALREAKRHSTWTKPNKEYEEATTTFAQALLLKNKPFWKSFQDFHKKIIDSGIINSLAQVVLKFCCPGVPDTYQGCELWDLSFVDPDNRRSVDYDQRAQWLDEIEKKGKDFLLHLWQHRYDGRIKLWMTTTLQNLRKQQPDVFLQGGYIPLKTEGIYKNYVMAFARRYRQQLYIVAVPLHTASLCKEQHKEVTALDWKDTCIPLPKEATGEWNNVLLQTGATAKQSIALQDIFRILPLAVLKAGIKDNQTALPEELFCKTNKNL